MNQKYTFPTVTEALPFICSRLLDIGCLLYTSDAADEL